MSKNIEVKGVNFINKGAELMLMTIKQEVLSKYPDAKICLNLRSGSARKIISKGFFIVPHYFSKKFGFINKILNVITFFIPSFILKRVKLVKVGDIDVVLDASGFTYSDQWGYESMEVMYKYYQKIRSKGGKVIFLPQAFGPFEKPNSKRYSTELFKQADVIYTRDDISLSYVRHVTNNKGLKAEPYPDFTNLLQVQRVEANKFKGKVCIIPNYRIIDKGEGKPYLSFLANVIDHLNDRNLSFYFLIHETDKDMKILNELNSSLNMRFDFVAPSSPIEIKSLIGDSLFVIGSRFHGLISALSQNVPVIISGWSHKYEELSKDYGINDFMIRNFAESERTNKLMEEIIDNRDVLIKEISENGRLIKEKANVMWSEIFEVLDR